MSDPKTEELRLEQLEREAKQRAQAREADQAAEERQHERRADKAAYLRSKLADRAEAEDES